MLDGKRPPYVPWYFWFTLEAMDKLAAHYGTRELDGILHPHCLGMGNAIGRFEAVGPDRYRDVDELFDDLLTIGLDCFNPFQPEVMNVGELLPRYRGRHHDPDPGVRRTWETVTPRRSARHGEDHHHRQETVPDREDQGEHHVQQTVKSQGDGGGYEWLPAVWIVRQGDRRDRHVAGERVLHHHPVENN